MNNNDMKPIKNHDGYFITNDGRVYSNLPIGGKQKNKPGTVHELTTYPDRKGYIRVGIYNSETGKRDLALVHRLVAEAFIPNPSDLPEVNHKHGDKSDNRVSELEWVTHAGNNKHARDTGLWNNKGENAHQATLSDEQVNEIRKNYKCRDPEFGGYAFAEKFGVSRSVVSKVIRGKTWSHDTDYIPPSVKLKLSSEDVREIRNLYKKRDPKFCCSALARKYGVAEQTINDIVNHKTWKDVD